MNKLERFFERKKSAPALPEAPKKENSESPIEKVFVKEEREGIILSGWQEVSSALYKLGEGDPSIFSKEDLRARDTERHDLEMTRGYWSGITPFYEIHDVEYYPIRLLELPPTTKEDIESVLQAAKATLHWKKSWSEDLDGLGRSFAGLNATISKVDENDSYHLSLYSENFGKLPEEELAQKLGKEQAVENIKVVLQNSRNFDLKINFEELAEKFGKVIRSDEEKPLSGKEIENHFVPGGSRRSFNEPFILGEIEGFRVSIETPGAYSDIWHFQKEIAKVRGQKNDENFLPPSFEISIKDGDNVFVTDPERKTKMRELAGHIAEAFRPQAHQ